MNTANLLIFLHIPKTAGSTMNHILARQFPAEAVYSIDGDRVQESYNTLRSLPDEEKQKLACVKGHMPFGVHEIFSQQATYITFLRDPAEWVRSYYTFILSVPTHPFYRDVAACQNLDEFCTLLGNWGMNNFQTRMLVGTTHHENIMPPYESMPDNALSIAIKHIEEHVSVVGLCEEFDKSLLLIKHRLGWKRIYYVRQNVTNFDQDLHQLTKHHKDSIYKSNSIDLALYRYAQERLNEQIILEGNSFTRHFKCFMIINRLFGGVYRYYLLLKINHVKRIFCRLFIFWQYIMLNLLNYLIGFGTYIINTSV